MSKLQELIDRLCPDGVPFKPLGEVGTFTRGNGLQKKILQIVESVVSTMDKYIHIMAPLLQKQNPMFLNH